MKAIVTLKSVSRGDNGDTIKFIDDASQELPPAVALNSEKRHAKALRWDKEAGKLEVSTKNGGPVFLEVRGEIQRTDAWNINKDTGEIEATASLTFICSCRLKHGEVAALFGAENICISFTPAQKTMSLEPRKKQEAA